MKQKKYIEQLLIEDVCEMNDKEAYRYLLATRPEGQVMAGEKEKDEFMRRHGLGPYNESRLLKRHHKRRP